MKLSSVLLLCYFLQVGCLDEVIILSGDWETYTMGLSFSPCLYVLTMNHDTVSFCCSQFLPFLVFILQKKLIVNFVKIQNDGTVEVDLAKSSPVASELLELSSFEGTSFDLDDTYFYETNKSIPRLKIAILVVGTRGDVQTFLAMAKRLQVCLTLFVDSPYCHWFIMWTLFPGIHGFGICPMVYSKKELTFFRIKYAECIREAQSMNLNHAYDTKLPCGDPYPNLMHWHMIDYISLILAILVIELICFEFMDCLLSLAGVWSSC